jgi:trigger factor
MALDATRLKVSLEEGARWRRTLHVTVPADLVQAEQNRMVQELSGRVRLPGFRSGKIPKKVLEKRFGGAVQRESLDRIIGDAYREALQRESIRPISEGDVEDITYKPQEDLTFRISFDVSPQVEFSRLGGFTVERPSLAPGADEVVRVLEQLRDQHGRWEEGGEGTPSTGDKVSVSITNLSVEGSEARDYDLVLGGGDAIPDVEDAIRTLEVGKEADFVVHFPDDFPDESRRGEEQQLRILLREKQLRILPEITDEFAATVGDFETVEILRARILEDLTKEAQEQAEGAVRGQLLDHVLEANPFEVPESMVLQYVKSVLGEEKPAPEKLVRAREAFGAEAERAVQRILIIERVAETQGLRATDDEIDARIEAIAEANGTSPAEVYGRFQKAGRLEMLEREITEGKVFEFLQAQSEIRNAG